VEDKAIQSRPVLNDCLKEREYIVGWNGNIKLFETLERFQELGDRMLVLRPLLGAQQSMLYYLERPKIQNLA
jgi:hypothetical protein